MDIKFNSLVQKINRNIAEELPYRGLVIDMGCGTSPYKGIIREKASEYIGVDWKKGIKGRREIDVLANLNESLPFKACIADTITAFQVIEHLAEPEKFLLEAYRILKDKGRIFITVPFMWHVHEAPHDYYRYTRYGLKYILEKTGYNVEDITENTGFWQMWILKFNYHIYRKAPRYMKSILVPAWWFGQKISPYMDKIDRAPQETASYTVIAKKDL